MTPVGFVFLTLMFGVIFPTPTNGKIKMTFKEAMSMKSSALEKRQGDFSVRPVIRTDRPPESTPESPLESPPESPLESPPESPLESPPEDDTGDGEHGAFMTFMRCLNLLRLGTGKSCDDVYSAARLEEISKKYGEIHKIPLADWERIALLQCQPPRVCDKSNKFCNCDFCGRVQRDPRVTCDKEYEAFHQSISDGRSGRSRGVSFSKSGWCITVMAATAYATSRRHFSLP